MLKSTQTPPATPLALTSQQLAVLRLIAAGYTDQQIGCQLAVSTATVHFHLYKVLQILGVRNRAQAVGEAYRRNLL